MNRSLILMSQGIFYTSNTENIGNRVQRICSGNSVWFVPEPSPKPVHFDLLIALRIFNNVFRWKDFWLHQKQQTELELPENYESRFKLSSLNTRLKPKFGLNIAKHRSKTLKSFLSAVEIIFLKEASNAAAFNVPT